MLNIAIGTTSSYKIPFVKEIISSLNIEATLVPTDTNSGVTHQPRTEKETKRVSINRAREALKKNQDCDFGLGIEIGYEPIDGVYFMHGWASIIDKEGRVYSEQSSTLELPKYFLQFLHDNEDDGVGYHVKEFTDKKGDGTWKEFAKIIQFREPFIKESARNVLLRYIYRNEY